MTIQEAIKVLENVVTFDYTEEVEAIDVVLKALKESKKEGKWKPKTNGRFWYISLHGEIMQACWVNDESDNYLYNHQPIFATRDECERYKLFMDTVKEKSYEFSKEEWEDRNIAKYTVYYSYKLGCFEIGDLLSCKFLGQTYFKTEEDAQYIIDNFQDELMEFWI